VLALCLQAEPSLVAARIEDHMTDEVVKGEEIHGEWRLSWLFISLHCFKKGLLEDRLIG